MRETNVAQLSPIIMPLLFGGDHLISNEVHANGKKRIGSSNLVISGHEMQERIIVQPDPQINVKCSTRSDQDTWQVDLIVDGVMRKSSMYSYISKKEDPKPVAS